jgi:hypothetical protein
MAIIDTVQQYLGSSQVDEISRQLGVDPNTAQRAISAALPMILGGMAGHAAQPQGAESIKQAVATHANVTDNIQQLVQTGPPADIGISGGLLGRILGGHRDTVEQGVQQTSGLDADKTKRLLMMLAPIVLGVLARRQFGGKDAQQADPGQLQGALHQEAQAAAKESPHVGGLLGKILGAVESPRA